MSQAITAAARLVRAVYEIYTRKWSFLATFCVLFFLITIALGHLDLLPEARPADDVTASETLSSGVTPLVRGVGSTERRAVSTLPVSLSIPSIDLSVTVGNPESTDIAVLDKALLSGAVRYPTSAALGEEGNVIIFGHSSHLPVVHNGAYKAFNGIEKLERGDEIVVSSALATYRYVVLSVAKESAESDVAIPLQVGGRLLTLATCDSFGKKTDRYIVTAILVESPAV